jgi:hypothetical protein
MEESLLDKLDSVLKEEGILYSNPKVKNIKCTTVLVDYNKKADFPYSYLENSGRILGFEAYHKLTSNRYDHEALISKKIGNPGRLIIMDGEIPVDHAPNLESALERAHEYLFNEITKEVLEPFDVYINLLDTTKLGIEKFKKREALKSKGKKSRK